MTSKVVDNGIGYICRDCALEHRHTLADNRGVTCHEGVCETCGKVKALAHVSDYGLTHDLEWTDAPPLD